MLIEAAGLAILAAISLAALLLAAVYLGSARPRATIRLYRTGAVGRLIANPAPYTAVLVAPEPTRRLQAVNGWLRRNGRMILACPLVAVGLIVAIDGLVGLTKKG